MARVTVALILQRGGWVLCRSWATRDAGSLDKPPAPHPLPCSAFSKRICLLSKRIYLLCDYSYYTYGMGAGTRPSHSCRLIHEASVNKASNDVAGSGEGRAPAADGGG